MIKFISALSLLIFACGENHSDKVYIPKIDRQYYESSISSIEEKIRDNPEDARFIRLQLSYFEKLGWPITAKEAINRAKTVLHSDPIFLDQQITFYKHHHQHSELQLLLNDMGSSEALPVDLLTEKIRMNLDDSNLQGLRDDLRILVSKDSVDNSLVARGYFLSGDSVNAADYFIRTEENRIDSSQINRFIPILITLNQRDSAKSKLGDYLKVSDDSKARLLLANLHLEDSDSVTAKSILQSGGKEEFVFLSKLYEHEGKWDSAQLYVSELIIEDPNDIDIILYGGNLNHRRGYFNTSLGYYFRVLDMDSTQSEAIKQIDIVNRKIAYLQKIREAEKDIPILNLNSKKVNN